MSLATIYAFCKPETNLQLLLIMLDPPLEFVGLKYFEGNDDTFNDTLSKL